MTNRRLFLFGIGGTGSRVIKALTFMLASGVKADATQIVPIIIDPDRENGDLNRTIEILKNYRNVRSALGNPTEGFFSTEISTLADLEKSSDGRNSKISEGFSFQIDGARDRKFRDFIKYDQLENLDRMFINLLFHDQLLNSDLNVGFRGHPNMGSVVLNQMKDMHDFRYFANLFKSDDRIFIISSIFGGTGAAGFPLLVKNIREPEVSGLANADFLKNARVGAVTLLPYFGVEEDAKSAVQKGTFVTKTKAALNYYRQDMNKKLNMLYYIGDHYTGDYKNHEGKADQKNDAHLVELLAATSILEFLRIEDKALITSKGEAKEPKFMEYGARHNAVNVDFKVLGDRTKATITKCITQYAYCCKYWNEQLPKSLGNQAWAKGKSSKNSNVAFDKSFITASFYSSYLEPFNNRFIEWLREMSRQKGRKFSPFDLDTKQLHKFVTGVEQRKTGGFFGKIEWDYDYFENALNSEEMSLTQADQSQKFMQLFWLASNRIYNDKLENHI